jgi:malonate transporter
MTKKWFIAPIPFREFRIPMVELLGLVAPVFGLVALGYGAALAGLIGERAGEGLTAYLFVIGAPALMFKLLTAAVFPGVFPWGYWIAYYAGMAVVWVLATWLATRLFRRNRGDAVIAGLSTGQANTVLIGIPIILKAYGEEAAFPIAMLLAVNLPITMTLATLMLEGTRAATGGTLFVKLGRGLIDPSADPRHGRRRRLPGRRHPARGRRGDHAGHGGRHHHPPVAHRPRPVAEDLRAARGRSGGADDLSRCSLIVHPAIAYVVAHHVFALPPAWTGTVVLFAAMPAGINAYLFAARYGQGVGIASTAVALSTLLAVASSILWLRVLGIG